MAIARALIKQPRLFLQMRPAGIWTPWERDYSAYQWVFRYKRKITTLIVTHDYTLIPEIVDVYQLENQQVLKLGEQ